MSSLTTFSVVPPGKGCLTRHRGAKDSDFASSEVGPPTNLSPSFGQHQIISMKPILLLSSAALLGSQAFAWIALLPSFHFQCRATALALLLDLNSPVVCRRVDGSSSSSSSSSSAASHQPMGSLGGVTSRLSRRGGATAAAMNRNSRSTSTSSSVSPLEASAAASVSATARYGGGITGGGTGRIGQRNNDVSSTSSLSSSSNDQQHHPNDDIVTTHQLINSSSSGTFVSSSIDDDEGGRRRERKSLIKSAALVALAVGAAVAVFPGPQGSPSILANLLHSLKPIDGHHPTGRDLYWRIFLAGGVCASTSHSFAVPLDVVKTRLQTDPDRYKGIGIWGSLEKIRREEGPRMLLKGLGATLIGYSIQGSLKYGLYAIFKAVVKGALPHSSIFVNYILASICADVIASTALCPLEATRIRLVADPKFASGTFDGLFRLIEEEGWGAIFKGMPAILAKQLPYTIVQLCGFELITRVFYSWDVTAAILLNNPGPWKKWLVSFGSALITGIFASLASQPGDVILSRVNKDKSDKPVLVTMRDTVKGLGLKGLFRGTRARLLHVGMIVTVQLVIYDFVKQVVGLPATGAGH